MRKAQKTQIEETFSLMGKVHEEIRKQMAEGNRENVMQLLNDCQEGAIQAGNLIEQTEGEGAPAISKIEEYCETCYCIYEETEQGKDQSPSGVYRLLQKALAAMDSSVRLTIPVRLEIAFFCYKASMSDCLESIYFAAKEDPTCDAYFIPIPYYDKYPNGAFGEMHYEAEGCYPDTYELVDWEKYNVEVRRPDIIYIMNPYDNMNLVTSVHPDFYAERLRTFTDCLVYVPYLIHMEVPDKGTGTTPGVLYSDLTFVQSENVRNYYMDSLINENDIDGITLRVAKEKIIALGSPKIDKILRTDKTDYILPEKWQRIVDSMSAEQRIVLYNPSIYGVLNAREDNGMSYLRKLRSALDFFRKRHDIVLWLRPHPLLLQTFHSMRAKIADEYEEIIRSYQEEGWGIYDDTADMDRAVAWADTCYGDSSSVELLFEFLGKPVLLQNVSNAGAEPEAAGSIERVRQAMDIFVGKDLYNSYVMIEAKDETEEDQFSMADFFSHLDVILEYSECQKAKFRKLYANPDGTAGKKIHEYTVSLLRRARRE